MIRSWVSERIGYRRVSRPQLPYLSEGRGGRGLWRRRLTPPDQGREEPVLDLQYLGVLGARAAWNLLSGRVQVCTCRS